MGLTVYQQQQVKVQQVKQLTDFAEELLTSQPFNAENNVLAQVNAIAAVDLSRSLLMPRSRGSIAHSAHSALLHSIQVDQGRRLLLDPVVSIAFSFDGKKVVSGDRDHTVRVWNAQTRQPLGQRWRGHQKTVLAVAFSPDGRQVVSGSVDQTIRVWDARTGKLIGKPLKGHRYSVVSIAFSPDGSQIVSGSDDQTVRVWDVKTGQQIRQLQGTMNQGHFQPIWVGFSPDGQTILSRNYNNIVRQWNASTGELQNDLKGEDFQTTSMIFSAAGKTIVSDGYNNAVGSEEELLNTACLQLNEYSNLMKSETSVAKKVKQICDRRF
ncbi:MAG: WD40 repeat domain-containing protein [Leptolyngbyaceae cyanobacterium CSU_1_4]|nr:WD40 repeat domain-containing protein [Leptolyngbyaceae cyanobacterium CSU_1_4]